MYWEDKRLWWENVKYEIKKYSIKYSRLIQKVKRSKEKEIRDKLKEELNKEEVNVQNVIIMEEKLKKFEESKCNGAMLRSKAKYTVEGEKCTRFFFNLERGKAKSEMIKELKNENGEVIKETKGILEVVRSYYEELFKTKDTDGKMRNNK